MFMRKYVLIASVVAVLWAFPVQAELRIGDSAPPVSFTDWVKGGPVDLVDAIGKKVLFIEFWATWCGPCIQSIPHLSGLQRKYRDDGLIVIGAANPGRGESLAKVRKFVTKRQDSMDYIVAYDAKGQTVAGYMQAAGEYSIPHAFLIDRSGRLAWHGHPGLPGLDGIIDAVIKGKFDVTAARKQAEVEKQLEGVFSRLQRSASLGDWGAFKGAAKQALEIDPANEMALSAALYVYVDETKDFDGLRELVRAHIETHQDDVKVMTAVARFLLGIGALEARLPDLALQASVTAYRATNGKDGDAVGNYARALYEIGLIDRAIELQTKALSLAEESQRADIQKVLDVYKQCKRLQAEHQ